MNLNTLKKLYYNSPNWVKSLYSKIPYEIRAGRDYTEWNNFLKSEFQEEYPLIKLKETLFIAQDQIPFYQKSYKSLGSPGIELTRLKDINQLPMISKEIVKENFNQLINPNCKNSFYVTTGGSSGEQMKFLQSGNIWAKEQAFVHSIFARFNYKPTDLKASFRGAQFSKLRKNTYWHINPIQNEIQFSPFHLNTETISFYIQEINKRKPKYIHGYPSALKNFVQLASNSKISLDTDIKGIFLISENYEQTDIEIIKSYFNCPLLSFYGHSERLIIAPTLDNLAQVYNIDQRYGYFELINKNGVVIDKADIRGEIVGTSFDNFAMPLIRYRTGDFTSLHFSDSAGEIRINPIEGRWKNEFIEGSNGEKLTLTAINFHSDIFEGINTYQFLQEKKGHCSLLLTSNKTLSEKQLSDIYNFVNLKIGHAIDLEINQIENPILTSRGKFLRLIKRI